MSVSRDEVIAAYRLMLGRDPESESAIQSKMRFADLRELRLHFVRSAEYYQVDKVNRELFQPRALIKNKLFWLTVVIPTLLAVVYFGLIASDVYVSESRFVVRSPERQATSPLDALARGVGVSKGSDDAYAIVDFILSRGALAGLDDKLQLKKGASAPSVDVFNRFAGLEWDNSFEALHLYYQKKIVTVQQDASSSIVTLVTRAFTREDALAFNRYLLDASEVLVNQINKRAERDTVAFATTEVAEAEERDKLAALALVKFRNEKNVVDPERQTTIPLQQIAKLQDELISIGSQIQQLERIANDNPQLPVLRQQRQLLEREIQKASARLTGAGTGALVNKAADFARLVLEKDFADKRLAGAMAALAVARGEAQRKHLYLERFVEPRLPDYAREPRRVRSVAAVFILGMTLWGVLTMLIAGIKEHME